MSECAAGLRHHVGLCCHKETGCLPVTHPEARLTIYSQTAASPALFTSASSGFQVFHHVAAPAIMLITLLVVVLRGCSFIVKTASRVWAAYACTFVYALVTVSMHPAFSVHSGYCWKNSQCEGGWWGVGHRMGLLLHTACGKKWKCELLRSKRGRCSGSECHLHVCSTPVQS